MNLPTMHETGCGGEAQHLPAVVVVKRPGCSQPCSTRLWPDNSNVKRQTVVILAACNANGCSAVEPATAVTRELPCLSRQARQGAQHATLNTSKLPTEEACPRTTALYRWQDTYTPPGEEHRWPHDSTTAAHFMYFQSPATYSARECAVNQAATASSGGPAAAATAPSCPTAPSLVSNKHVRDTICSNISSRGATRAAELRLPRLNDAVFAVFVVTDRHSCTLLTEHVKQTEHCHGSLTLQDRLKRTAMIYHSYIAQAAALAHRWTAIYATSYQPCTCLPAGAPGLLSSTCPMS